MFLEMEQTLQAEADSQGSSQGEAWIAQLRSHEENYRLVATQAVQVAEEDEVAEIRKDFLDWSSQAQHVSEMAEKGRERVLFEPLGKDAYQLLA